MELKNVANQLENKALINKLHKEIVNRRGNEFMNN